MECSDLTFTMSTFTCSKMYCFYFFPGCSDTSSALLALMSGNKQCQLCLWTPWLINTPYNLLIIRVNVTCTFLKPTFKCWSLWSVISIIPLRNTPRLGMELKKSLNWLNDIVGLCPAFSFSWAVRIISTAWSWETLTSNRKNVQH